MAQWEQRTRLHFFLPSNNPVEAFVVLLSISKLKDRYDGCTHTLLFPPVFVGHYRKDTQWIRDRLVWLFVDSPEAVTDPGLLNYLSTLKEQIKDDYERVGSPQDEIWVTTEPVNRVA